MSPTLKIAKILVAMIGILLAACASIPPPAERRELADTLAQSKNWVASRFDVGELSLLAYQPAAPVAAKHLTIYIEGDGFSWVTASQASADPTPRDPFALRLALAHPEGAAAYLARPCQYADAETTGCPSRYWTDARFSPEVIEAGNRAVDLLKARFQATHLTLVGYSGGGAVATLLAARRRDVAALVTIAGNLDHEAWTTYHRISPLKRSLNPAHQVAALGSVRQWHFVGGKDENITPALIGGFVERFPASKRPVVIIEPRFDHRCCWAEEWPRLAPLFLRPLERQ